VVGTHERASALQWRDGMRCRRADGDGALTDEQVRIGLTTVGIPPTRALLREVRGDGRGGRVDFSRFVDAVETITTREPIDVKGIREALRRFERDAAPPGELPGHVMRYVLAGIPNVFGTNLTEEDVDEIFRALGLDEESPVDALEFVRALTSGFVHMPREPSLSGTGGEPVNLAVTAPPTAGTLAGLWAPPAPRQ
jgi:Ca2+-binding EF-hand superfamily protein